MKCKALTRKLLELARVHRHSAPEGVLNALQAAMAMNEADNPDFNAYDEIWKMDT